MRPHRSRNVIFLLLSIIAAMVLYGCSSGGGGDQSDKTVALAFDTDQDGTPDVFDDLPDNASSADYYVCDEPDGTAHHSMETALGKEQPFPAQTTFKGDIDAQNNPDYFAVELEAGTTYSIVFYDPQELDGRAVTFAPDVTVYTGSVSYLVGLPWDEEEPIQGVSSVIDNTDRLSLEFSSVADSRVIILSFTPEESRTHYIALRNGQADGQTGQYCFDLIEDEDKDGMTVDYKASDAGDYTYTHEDILYLKGAMKPYVAEWASDGTPQTFGEGAQTAFLVGVSYLAALRDEPVCSDQTSLSPYVSDIPWNSDYKFGYGIDATTGLPSHQLQAVTSFTPPVPVSASTKTETKVYFVNTDELYSKEIQAGMNTTFSSFGVTFKASGSYSDNIKYSEKETTLILKYNIRETEYRLFDPAGGAYSLTNDAKAYLATHADDFRNQYGDYFIAGARYGAQYVATIHIKASSAEEIRSIETKLTQASKTYNFDATEEFKMKFTEATKNSSVEVNRTTIGGNDAGLSAGTTPEQMFDDLKTFIQSCTKENRAPLEAYMFRFNQMPDGARIGNAIKVNSCVFSATRDLSKDFLALSSRARTIADLDASSFQAGVQEDYAQEYDNLVNEISDNRQAIFQDKEQVEIYGAKVKAALSKFSDLIDRQSFFLKLVQLQKTWPQHTGHEAREMGFKSYYLSRTIDNDICKPGKAETYNAEYHEGWHVGWRNWYPSWTPGDNSIVCYIKIDVDGSTKGDDCWDENFPSLGRERLSFHFRSGYDRMGSWWLKAKGIYLGAGGKSAKGNYPFNWELML